jgi:hypothetical protein
MGIISVLEPLSTHEPPSCSYYAQTNFRSPVSLPPFIPTICQDVLVEVLEDLVMSNIS